MWHYEEIECLLAGPRSVMSIQLLWLSCLVHLPGGSPALRRVVPGFQSQSGIISMAARPPPLDLSDCQHGGLGIDRSCPAGGHTFRIQEDLEQSLPVWSSNVETTGEQLSELLGQLWKTDLDSKVLVFSGTHGSATRNAHCEQSQISHLLEPGFARADSITARGFNRASMEVVVVDLGDIRDASASGPQCTEQDRRNGFARQAIRQFQPDVIVKSWCGSASNAPELDQSICDEIQWLRAAQALTTFCS